MRVKIITLNLFVTNLELKANSTWEKSGGKTDFEEKALVSTAKASVTIMADFSPEFDPPVRWRSKHKTKNDC